MAQEVQVVESEHSTHPSLHSMQAEGDSPSQTQPLSYVQVGEQPSLARRLESSQTSDRLGSRAPFPQPSAIQELRCRVYSVSHSVQVEESEHARQFELHGLQTEGSPLQNQPCSTWQVSEHPSSFIVLPSSHSSPASKKMFPHPFSSQEFRWRV